MTQKSWNFPLWNGDESDIHLEAHEMLDTCAKNRKNSFSTSFLSMGAMTTCTSQKVW